MAWVLNDPPPRYGEELAKCQYYYRKMGAGLTALAQYSDQLIFTFPLSPSVRIAPAISLLRTTIELVYGGSSLIVQNARIAAQLSKQNGVVYIVIQGDYSSTPVNGAVYRYNSDHDLFELDANL